MWAPAIAALDGSSTLPTKADEFELCALASKTNSAITNAEHKKREIGPIIFAVNNVNSRQTPGCTSIRRTSALCLIANYLQKFCVNGSQTGLRRRRGD